jgi:hypothetical protein
MCILPTAADAGESQYEKILKTSESRMDYLKGKNTDDPLFKETLRLLWYGAKIEPQRPEAYYLITQMEEYNRDGCYYSYERYGGHYIMFVYDKLMRMSKNCSPEQAAKYKSARDNFMRKLKAYEKEKAESERKGRERFYKDCGKIFEELKP